MSRLVMMILDVFLTLYNIFSIADLLVLLASHTMFACLNEHCSWDI